MFGVLIICITSDLRKCLAVMTLTFQSGAKQATRWTADAAGDDFESQLKVFS